MKAYAHDPESVLAMIIVAHCEIAALLEEVERLSKIAFPNEDVALRFRKRMRDILEGKMIEIENVDPGLAARVLELFDKTTKTGDGSAQR